MFSIIEIYKHLHILGTILVNLVREVICMFYDICEYALQDGKTILKL